MLPKLMIFAMPMQSIRGILKVVQLDSVQDLEVNCTWKLATLGRFMLSLAGCRIWGRTESDTTEAT